MNPTTRRVMCDQLHPVPWWLRSGPSCRAMLLLCALICLFVRTLSGMPIQSAYQLARLAHYSNEPHYHQQYHFDRPTRLSSSAVLALDHRPKWKSESPSLLDDDAFEAAEDGEGHQSITEPGALSKTNTVQDDDYDFNQTLVDHGSSGQDFSDADFAPEVSSHLEPHSRKRRLRFDEQDDGEGEMVSPHQNFAIGARIGDVSRLRIGTTTVAEQDNELDSPMMPKANQEPLVRAQEFSTHHSQTHVNTSPKPVTNGSNEPVSPPTQSTERTEPKNYYRKPVAFGDAVANGSRVVHRQKPSSESQDASESDSWKVAHVPQPKSIDKARDDSASSLMTQGYSNRDRGFGFIKAWAWDRSENYKIKNADHRRGHSSSTGHQVD